MPFVFFGLSLFTGLALAEKADQDKPLILNADSLSINEVEQKYKLLVSCWSLKVQVFWTRDVGCPGTQVSPLGSCIAMSKPLT